MQAISEVARIREQIATEYMAARLGLHGLSCGTARHQFITVRQERIGALHEALRHLVGDEAMALVAETLDALPEKATQQDVLTLLQHELSKSEETEHLLDWIQDMWETREILVERFGIETAYKILLAPVLFPDWKTPSE